LWGKLQKEVENLEDLFVIVGLGNPGAKYENTRHNVGFDTVEFLSKDMILGWESLSTRLLSAMER